MIVECTATTRRFPSNWGPGTDMIEHIHLLDSDWTLYILLWGSPTNSYMLNPPTSHYPSSHSLAFHTFAAAVEPDDIPMQYISTLSIVYFRRGVLLGINTIGRL
jgi:hypothetical protein